MTLKLSLYSMFFQFFSKHFHIVWQEVNFTYEEEIKFILEQLKIWEDQKKMCFVTESGGNSSDLHYAVPEFYLVLQCTSNCFLIRKHEPWLIWHFLKLIIMLFKGWGKDSYLCFLTIILCFLSLSLSWQYFASRPNRFFVLFLSSQPLYYFSFRTRLLASVCFY